MGCFYCDEHHEGREAIMYKVGEMEAGVLYLFKDQAHKGRCALALKNHRKELCECGPEELAAFARDLARASGAVKELWGCDKINLGSFGDTNPHLHIHIVPIWKCRWGFVSYPNTRADSSSAVPLPSRIRSRCCSPRANIKR